jgi:hypothetical protein
MTDNLSEEILPMLEDELDVRCQAVNEVSVKQLPMLLADLEEVVGDKDLLQQYEIDFLGDLYARMIVSVIMGFQPEVMGKDAQDAAERLIKFTEDEE